MRKIKTVLVVDDDAAALFVAKKVLGRMGLAENIMTATNGLEGFLMVKEACATDEDVIPELILVDLKMPVMNGFKMIEAMKGLSFPTKPIVAVLTSSENVIDREKARMLNTDGYLIKPIHEESIEAMLEALPS